MILSSRVDESFLAINAGNSAVDDSFGREIMLNISLKRVRLVQKSTPNESLQIVEERMNASVNLSLFCCTLHYNNAG